jgi:hypothetical protein
VSVFNGSIAKHYIPSSDQGGVNPIAMGTIESEAREKNMQYILLTPITTTFRGLDSASCPYPIGKMNPTGVALPIDGVRCREYVMKTSATTSVSCWLDPAKEYVIRRFRCLERPQNRLTEQIDVTYRPHEVCGWVPVSWIRTQYSSAGNVLITTNVAILILRINEAQPAEQFDIQFPPGCHVQDHRNGKDYLVQPDGMMREFSVATGDLLSGSVAQPGTPWVHRHKWLLASLTVVLLALILAVWLRWKRLKGV